MTRLFFVVVIFGLLAGCTAFEKADSEITSGNVETAIFNIEYTPIEQQIIRHANQNTADFTKTGKDSYKTL